MEEYENSFSYLSAELLQLSTGNFESSVTTFSHDLITLDRRITTTSHLHHCTVAENTLNFVLPNSLFKLNINGRDINEERQIIVKEEQEIKAIVTGQLDITSVVLPLSRVLTFLPDLSLQYTDLDFSPVRLTHSNIITKNHIRSLINNYLNYLINSDDDLYQQTIVDIAENITFQLIDYYESLLCKTENHAKKLSTRELDRLISFVMITDVFSLSDLQSICMCSPRTLNNLINNQFGCSPSKFVSTVRLNRIHRYLHSPSNEKKSIKAICDKFGVYSQYRLANSYKKMFGICIQDSVRIYNSGV
jgi:AraC-like DNA-binding protein